MQKPITYIQNQMESSLLTLKTERQGKSLLSRSGLQTHQTFFPLQLSKTAAETNVYGISDHFRIQYLGQELRYTTHKV